MKLPVVSIDFETHEVTFQIDQNVSDRCEWCFGDECDVDLSIQLGRRNGDQPKNKIQEQNNKVDLCECCPGMGSNVDHNCDTVFGTKDCVEWLYGWFCQPHNK